MRLSGATTRELRAGGICVNLTLFPAYSVLFARPAGTGEHPRVSVSSIEEAARSLRIRRRNFSPRLMLRVSAAIILFLSGWRMPREKDCESKSTVEGVMGDSWAKFWARRKLFYIKVFVEKLMIIKMIWRVVNKIETQKIPLGPKKSMINLNLNLPDNCFLRNKYFGNRKFAFLAYFSITIARRSEKQFITSSIHIVFLWLRNEPW